MNSLVFKFTFCLNKEKDFFLPVIVFQQKQYVYTITNFALIVEQNQKEL